MFSFKNSLHCAGIYLRRSFSESKTWLALAVMTVFSFFIYSPLCKIAEFYQISISPWVFPFFLSFYLVLIVHGGLCLLIFSDMGEIDGYAHLMICRCGRSSYMIGLLLYIIILSFLYTATLLILSVLFILPVIGWDTDWGTLLYTLSTSSGQVMEQTGQALSLVVDAEVLSTFTPIKATLFSFMCLWVSAIFVGVLILFCRVWFGKAVGLIPAGIFVCMSLFVRFLGALTIGQWLQYFSPLTWANFGYLDWYYSGFTPSPAYAFTVWTVSIAAMEIGVAVRFCKRDLN